MLTSIRWLMAFTVLAILLPASSATAQPDRWDSLRDRMVTDVLKNGGIRDERVLQSMSQVPRHLFVSRNLRNQAYQDMALPIGEKQTISSPFIVAFMTECLDPQPSDRVLEIGTGSGYQAAVLANLAAEVYTIEIVPELGHEAGRLLKQLRYKNVQVRVGDGFAGWSEKGPFDKIIVTCSPEDVPQPLVDQLRDGGRMVIPVGERYQQTMYLFRKEGNELKQEALRPTLFVPMTGKAEEGRDRQPDPANPELMNGDFEAGEDENHFIRGWYYQRQASLRQGPDVPQGSYCVRFEANLRGQESHLMQGLALDGSRVRKLALSVRVRTQGVQERLDPQSGPRFAVTFYDENRRELTTRWLGPWTGDTPWRLVSEEVAVPRNAREAIVRIGLFGATGIAEFDEVRIGGERSPD